MVHRAVDGQPGQLVARQIEQKLASRVLGPWLDLGPFNWYSTGRPLNSYADLKGLKIRNSGGPGQAWRTRYMGAVPNTTPLPNVALGLSQGTFDGLITTNETIASAQFWESGVRHALEDRQFTGVYVPIISLAFWQKLSPELQQAFTDIWRENIADYRTKMAAAQARARDLVLSHGIKIVVPPAEELAAKRQEMLAHQENLAMLSRVTPEMVAALTAEVAAG
jgi:C4-dicarboxylate-binding protein DctP